IIVAAVSQHPGHTGTTKLGEPPTRSPEPLQALPQRRPAPRPRRRGQGALCDRRSWQGHRPPTGRPLRQPLAGSRHPAHDPPRPAPACAPARTVEKWQPGSGRAVRVLAGAWLSSRNSSVFTFRLAIRPSLPGHDIDRYTSAAAFRGPAGGWFQTRQRLCFRSLHWKFAMPLTERRYIGTLGQVRHVGRAAERCHVSQPTLSVGVKKLEDELGVLIFERSKSAVRVSPVGECIVAQAQKVLEQAQGIRELAQAGKNQLAAPLKLGAIYTVGPYLFPHLIPQLHRVAPDMPLYIE